MAFDWRWAAAGLWESLPSSLQDAIKKWGWDALIGSIMMGAYGIYVLMQETKRLPGEVQIVLALAVFAIGFVITTHVRWHRHMQRMKANIEAGGGVRQRLPNATAAQLTQQIIRGVRFHIHDLIRDGNVILRDKTIEECEVIGPAIFAMLGGNEMAHNAFGGTPNPEFNHYVWEVPADRTLVGVIGLENCAFRRCDFSNIALVGRREDVLEWRRSGFVHRPTPNTPVITT